MRNIVVAILLALTLAPGQAAGQDPFGFDFTNFLCKQSGLEPVRLGEAWRQPGKSVIILLGDDADVHSDGLLRFIRAGGAVLFATDRVSRRSGFFRIDPGPHRVSDTTKWYQGHDDCFRVPVREHEITRGVKEILVNRAGGVGALAGSWQVLADLPESRRSGLLAVYERGRGRCVVLSDHSPFTNDMLRRADNAILTVNIINWLSSDNRSNLTFIADGDQLDAASLPPMLPPDNIPDIDPNDIPKDKLPAIANRFLKEVERQNLLNRFLADIPNRYIWRWLLIISTLIASFILFRRLLRNRPVVQPPKLHAANGSEARALTMMRTKSLQPAAQELAREFMRTFTGDSLRAKVWNLGLGDIWVAPAVPSPRRIQADVRKMSELATGSDRRRRVKSRELRKLAARIEELKSLHQRGQLRLATQAATT